MEVQARQQTTKGPADWFTGDVYVDPIVSPTDTSRAGGGLVHFTPGARTHSHTDPYGQTIYVTVGIGRCQREGGPIEENTTSARTSCVWRDRRDHCISGGAEATLVGCGGAGNAFADGCSSGGSPVAMRARRVGLRPRPLFGRGRRGGV